MNPVNVNPTDEKTPSNGKLIDLKSLDSKSVNVRVFDLRSADVKPMRYANFKSQAKKSKSIFLVAAADA